MRIHEQFLMTWIVLLTCFGVLSSSLAEENLPAIVMKIQRSVVVIVAYDEEGEILKQGSGFFINERGDVITNRHVLEGACSAEVITGDGVVYAVGKVLAEDKESELIQVSVKIPTSAVHPVSVNATIPAVGERIVLIGTPLGLEATVSDGIVSAVRNVPVFGRIIQITAIISPGSSGSPVVNMKGEVVAVAAFLMMEGQNLSYATPGERSLKLVQAKAQTLSERVKDSGKELPEPPEKSYYSGLTWVLAEEYEKALFYLEQAVQKDTGDADAYVLIGYSNGELGRHREEVEAYRQAIRINPDDASAHHNLGVGYGKLGQHKEAMEAYSQAIRVDPDDADLHHALAVTYGKLGQYNEALEAYRQTILINPDHAEAHYGLGVGYSKLGRHYEALEAYKQAIRVNPDNAMAHYNLGVTYGELGQHTEAVEAYKQVIRINPDDAMAHNNMGITYGKLSLYNEQVEAYKRAILVNPDHAKAHYNLGVAYNKLGQHNEAVKAYKQVIRINPDDADAHFRLGLTHLAVGDSDSALDELKILRNLDIDLANQLFEFIPK